MRRIGILAALASAMMVPAAVPALVPIELNAVDATPVVKRRRRIALSLPAPKFRRSRNKPPKRKLHTNLAHRSKRVRRKHRRAA